MTRKIKDITGQKFGRLIALECVGFRNNKSLWKCKCDCGNTIEVMGSSLISNHTRSCGCLRLERVSKPNGSSSKQSLYSNYKHSAMRRGLEFNIPFEEFISLVSKECFYCGKNPSQRKSTGYNTGDFIYNGIDRVDNSKGYILDNCVPCCKTCNIAKRNLSLYEFLDWVEKIYINVSLKNREDM